MYVCVRAFLILRVCVCAHVTKLHTHTHAHTHTRTHTHTHTHVSISLLRYGYYMLAACGDSVKPYLWWKRYLTQLQLLQFFFVLITTSTATYLVRNGECKFFEWMGWANISYMVTMIALFTNFYVKSYKRKDRNDKDRKQTSKKHK